MKTVQSTDVDFLRFTLAETPQTNNVFIITLWSMFLAFFTTPGCFRKVYKMDKEAAARRNTRCIDKEDLFHFLQSYLCGYKSLYILTSCSVNP